MTQPADERELLELMLDDSRASFLRTLDGLTDEELKARLVPSLTTMLGLVTHLTFAEQRWFQYFLGGADPAALGIAADIDASFLRSVDADAAAAIDDLTAAIKRSREVVAGFDLDHTIDHPKRGRLTVRWVLAHMIEEVARHAGHADILREQLLAARSQ